MMWDNKEPRGHTEGGTITHKQIPKELSILPVRGTVLFPDLMMPLLVGRQESIQLVKEALAGDRIIGVIALRDPQIDRPSAVDLYRMGTAALITKMTQLPNGSISILVQGLSRIRITEFTQTTPYFRGTIEEVIEDFSVDQEIEALTRNIKRLFQKVAELAPNLSPELGIAVLNVENPSNLTDLVASNLSISLPEKQEVLETVDLKKRMEKVTLFLNKEFETLELSQKIQSQIKEGMDKTHREYYLKEQLKAIQKELGQEDEHTIEIQELRKRLEESKLPEEARKAAERELDRLSRMPPAAAEYTVSRTYLEWLLDLPWSISTPDTLDIGTARKILDEDHYDLEKIKKRILEYLAVRKLKPDMKGPILCFAGPPGVGKTSLGRSIARALGRKFVRISLGGVRDEAEIRGHRRTYVGALPGRIIQGLKKAGSNNPVFMLDEIDKIGTDFRGDPAAALLEVLDPEQNFSFSDHYLDVPFDLSHVIFITTANILETIPPALRDRMEVLDIPGYTEEEKIAIAREHIIPKQIAAHGLELKHLSFTDEAIRLVVASYTREAGLRNLEREIATICRGVAQQVAEGRQDPVIVTPDAVSTFLGPIRYFSEVAERTATPGVATGMAWTPNGGEIIFVEATKMPGRNNLLLTGQLGEVMKESAQAALSYVRSHAEELGIAPDFYEKHDLHIHVPAGAIPKDGPSAGVTILTALISLLTGKPVRSDVAMTGEITLQGLVLPVGGIKEKVLAAKRAGIRVVILPEKNQKDLEDIPEERRKELEFHFVHHVDEVINLAFPVLDQERRPRVEALKN